MSTQWTFRIMLDHLYRVGNLRSMPGIMASLDSDAIWLRGDSLDDALHRILSAVADGPVFQLAPDGRLTPFGCTVPTERLVAQTWQPLTELLRPVLPSPALTKVRLPRVTLHLERMEQTNEQHDAALLLTNWPTFRDWAESAAEIRLLACRFAVCSQLDGETDFSNASPRVAIVGNPLPPLPGKRFWLAGRVAVPLGFHWSPSVDSKTLERTLCPPQQDNLSRIWIWEVEENILHSIVSSELIPAVRANIRASDKSHQELT